MGMMWSLSDMRSETGHVRNFREMSGCFQNTLPPPKKNAEGWMMFLSKAFKLFQKMHEDAGISICVMETAVFFSGRGGGFSCEFKDSSMEGSFTSFLWEHLFMIFGLLLEFLANDFTSPIGSSLFLVNVTWHSWLWLAGGVVPLEVEV